MLTHRPLHACVHPVPRTPFPGTPITLFPEGLEPLFLSHGLGGAGMARFKPLAEDARALGLACSLVFSPALFVRPFNHRGSWQRIRSGRFDIGQRLPSGDDPFPSTREISG